MASGQVDIMIGGTSAKWGSADRGDPGLGGSPETKFYGNNHTTKKPGPEASLLATPRTQLHREQSRACHQNQPQHRDEGRHAGQRQGSDGQSEPTHGRAPRESDRTQAEAIPRHGEDDG